MKIKLLSLLAFLGLGAASLMAEAPAKEDRIVGGYVAYYSPLAPMPDPSLHTHLFYSFARPLMNADGSFNRIIISDMKYYQSDPDYKRMFQVLALKKINPDLKVCISFANSPENGGFSALVASDKARKAFADSCLAFCNRYGFDGVDLDWEFPGMAYSSKYAYDAVNDVDNYTKLVKVLSEKLHPAGKSLSFAGFLGDVSKSGNTKKYIDLQAVEPYMDFVNVMCYDIMSGPKPHNPLYYPSYPAWSIDGARQAYQKAGFPLSKVVIGVPFYAHPSTGGETYYKDIVKGLKNGTYTEHYNSTWQVPYISLAGSTDVYGTYDNPASIANKGKYVIDHNMRGLMYWEITGDDGTTLQTACWTAMKGSAKDTTCNPYGWKNWNEMYQALAADIYEAKQEGGMAFTFWGFNGTFDEPNVGTDISGISKQIATFDPAFFTTSPYKEKWGWLLQYIETCCDAAGKEKPSTTSNISGILRHNLAAFFANSVRTAWPQTADYTSIGVSSSAYETTWGYSLKCTGTDLESLFRDKGMPDVQKMLINGQLYILREGCLYSIQGQRVK